MVNIFPPESSCISTIIFDKTKVLIRDQIIISEYTFVAFKALAAFIRTAFAFYFYVQISRS